MDVHPFEHLMGTEFFLSQGKKELLHFDAGQAQQINLVGHISSENLRLAGAGAELFSSKKVSNFTGSRLDRVRTVSSVLVDGASKISADSACSCIFRVGRAHQVTVLHYRTLAFQQIGRASCRERV